MNASRMYWPLLVVLTLAALFMAVIAGKFRKELNDLEKKFLIEKASRLLCESQIYPLQEYQRINAEYIIPRWSELEEMILWQAEEGQRMRQQKHGRDSLIVRRSRRAAVLVKESDVYDILKQIESRRKARRDSARKNKNEN